jgi:hypothetical protein
MSHHTMTQMGHNVPNLIGIKPGDVDKRARALLKGYMTMGDTGMARMAEMGMRVPRNSLPMGGGPGKHGYIDMGGMFTVIKLRENLTSYDDPGWYDNPPGTLAVVATEEELRRDLGFVPSGESSMPMQQKEGEHSGMKGMQMPGMHHHGG